MIGYVRVSRESTDTALQQAGIQAQIRAIEEASVRTPFTLDRIVQEIVSAKSLDRPVLQAVLQDCADGAEGIVVAKLDRLSRSVIDFATLLERAKREGWNIMALDFGLDMSTPAGELCANVMMSVAQWERKVIGLRTKEALAERRAAGVKLGRPVTVPLEVTQRVDEMLRDGASVKDVLRAGVPMGERSIYKRRRALKVS